VEPTTPQAYRVRIKGNEVEMPREQVERLLEKVHSVDKEGQDVAQARKALALDYSVADWARQATPEQRAELQSLLEGRSVKASQTPAASDDDDDDGESPRTPATPPDYEHVKAALGHLMEKEEARLQAAARAERETTIDKALESYPLLKKEKGLLPIVRAKVVSDLAANPALDPTAVVAANAAEYSAWLDSARKSEAGSTSAVAQQRASGSPARGSNAGAPFTAKDMHDGKVKQAVLDAWRRGDLRPRR
jgi:hypothetical protein